MKLSIYSMLPEELEAFCKQNGQPAFRAKQIFDWLYGKLVPSFDEMKNLPAPLRDLLAEHFSFQVLEKLEVSGVKGETQKLLFQLSDQEMIETVAIPSRRRKSLGNNKSHSCLTVDHSPPEQRNTICISSQVGCRFGCAFCASGQKGVIRNLTAGEIVGQVLEVSRQLGPSTSSGQASRPNNVVFMGIGEPFDNYDAVMKSVRILNHPDGLNIGARKITVSTCGVVPGIERFAEEGLQVELSVSLHAPDNETRSKIMPVNETWPLAELMDACVAYTEKTNRIITFEYTLIKDLNDSPAQARELVQLLRRLPCRVNLIPLSPVEEFDGERPDSETMQIFFQTLEKAHINTTLRDSKGSNLKAACGQLRSRRID